MIICWGEVINLPLSRDLSLVVYGCMIKFHDLILYNLEIGVLKYTFQICTINCTVSKNEQYGHERICTVPVCAVHTRFLVVYGHKGGVGRLRFKLVFYSLKHNFEFYLFFKYHCKKNIFLESYKFKMYINFKVVQYNSMFIKFINL